MKIKFLWIGKSKNNHFNKIFNEYTTRLHHYVKNEIVELRDIKISTKEKELHKKREADLILSKFESSDYVILLDERGKHFTSVEYSKWIQHKMNISISSLVFVIAGAYGAHENLKQRADYQLALSQMTLTHDMARIFILEQTYRAFTIQRGEKYHNE